MPSINGFGSTNVDNNTLEINSSGQIQIKKDGITPSLFSNQTMTASDDVIHTNASEQSTTSTSLVKVKESVLPSNFPTGTIRVKASHRSSAAGRTSTIALYKNGVSQGTLSSGNYHYYHSSQTDQSLDISVQANDTIEIWLSVESGFIGYTQNLKICSVSNATIESTPEGSSNISDVS